MKNNPATETLPLEPVSEVENIETMERADTPAIWEDFKAKAEKLKLTAETLTVTDVSQVAEMKLARQTRLTLREVRIAIEAKRKELGETYLRKTQQINAEAKQLRELIEPLEMRLLDQEKFAERAEEARLVKLSSDRIAAISQYSEVSASINYATMPEEEFDKLLADAKAVYEARVAEAKRIEDERIAKEKADAEERERIRLENERLKKEAVEREAAATAEREKARIEAEKAAEVARKERDAIEAKAKAEKSKADAEAKAEREKAEALQAQIDRNAKAEKEAADAEAKLREDAELAPDKEKLEVFALQLRTLQMPSIASEIVKRDIALKLEEMAKWVETQSAKLKVTK